MPIKVVNPGPFKALAQYSLGEIPICLQVKFLTQILTPKKKSTFECKDPLPVHLTTRLVTNLPNLPNRTQLLRPFRLFQPICEVSG